MALQSTGAISLNDVQTEFGGSNPIGINEYYRGGSNVPDTPANSSIPTSGTIAMDDFYGGDSTPPPPATTYTFTTTPTSINEGSSGTFAITTTNVPNSTTLYWTTSHVTSAAADFTANSGSFTITSNSGTFTVSVAADTLTESTEYFRIQIRTGSSSGPVVATSNQVGINNIAPPSGYTWTTTSFSPNSYNGGVYLNNTIYDTSTATTSTVTVGSGNQTFPFTYTITNFAQSAPSYVNKILVLRNGTTVVSHTATSSTGTFSFTTSSTLNQIAFRTTVVAYDDDGDFEISGPVSTMKIYSNGTTLVWTHSYQNNYDASS